MIRRATIADIPAIQQMAEVVFRKTYVTMISPQQMDYMMDMMYSAKSLVEQMTVKNHIFFIDEGNGYASFHRDGKTESGQERFHLEKLYVMPTNQRNGLGKQLFETVCREVRALADGNPRIELNVNRNNPAVSFYEHMGMHKDRQGDFPIGNGFYMNDFIMQIDIVE